MWHGLLHCNKEQEKNTTQFQLCSSHIGGCLYIIPKTNLLSYPKCILLKLHLFFYFMTEFLNSHSRTRVLVHTHTLTHTHTHCLESARIHLCSPMLFLFSHLLSSRCQFSVKVYFSFDYFQIVYRLCQ